MHLRGGLAILSLPEAAVSLPIHPTVLLSIRRWFCGAGTSLMLSEMFFYDCLSCLGLCLALGMEQHRS